MHLDLFAANSWLWDLRLRTRLFVIETKDIFKFRTNPLGNLQISYHWREKPKGVQKISYSDWQLRYGTEEACARTLFNIRWPQGFTCPECGNDSAWIISTRKLYQCSKCRHQVSVTAGTLLHATNLPLVKWFLAIYLVLLNEEGISVLRLSKVLGVSWFTARNMLKKLKALETLHEHSLKGYFVALMDVNDICVNGKRRAK